jgi:hypothetical protein
MSKGNRVGNFTSILWGHFLFTHLSPHLSPSLQDLTSSLVHNHLVFQRNCENCSLAGPGRLVITDGLAVCNKQKKMPTVTPRIAVYFTAFFICITFGLTS